MVKGLDENLHKIEKCPETENHPEVSHSTGDPQETILEIESLPETIRDTEDLLERLLSSTGDKTVAPVKR